MSVISSSDFKGFVALSIDQTNTKGLQSFIDLYENTYICDLLGADLATLYLADLATPVNGEPTEQRFKDIHNAFLKQKNSINYKSDGIPSLLTMLIYWLYTTDSEGIQTKTGVRLQDNENSSRNSIITQSKAQKRWNRGIKTYKAIQWFICENIDDYPEFNGKDKNIRHFGLF